MMTVRNRVNMRAVYFILSLLLIACSKDDASEAPGKFELQNISIGEKQDQSSFENVAPNASIVLTFTDAVDEATIQSNIILKLNDQAVAYDSKLQGKDKLSLTPTGGFKSFSSYKLVINPPPEYLLPMAKSMKSVQGWMIRISLIAFLTRIY